MKKNTLIIKNLNVFVKNNLGERIEILKSIDFKVQSGEIHVLMGPNGSGKTTLAQSLMGNPKYEFIIQNSEFRINGKDMIKLKPEEKAKEGLFVSFQNPIEIDGVSNFSFLRTSYNSVNKKVPLAQFKLEVNKIFKDVSFSEDFMKRNVNKGFSGGEKKRFEIIQLMLLKPKFAILDEIDSGLDITNLKMLVKIVKNLVDKYKMGIILITHNPMIFNYLKADFIHVLINGKIKKVENKDLIKKIQKKGYDAV